MKPTSPIFVNFLSGLFYGIKLHMGVQRARLAGFDVPRILHRIGGTVEFVAFRKMFRARIEIQLASSRNQTFVCHNIQIFNFNYVRKCGKKTTGTYSLIYLPHFTWCSQVIGQQTYSFLIDSFSFLFFWNHLDLTKLIMHACVSFERLLILETFLYKLTRVIAPACEH